MSDLRGELAKDLGAVLRRRDEWHGAEDNHPSLEGLHAELEKKYTNALVAFLDKWSVKADTRENSAT